MKIVGIVDFNGHTHCMDHAGTVSSYDHEIYATSPASTCWCGEVVGGQAPEAGDVAEEPKTSKVIEVPLWIAQDLHETYEITVRWPDGRTITVGGYEYEAARAIENFLWAAGADDVINKREVTEDYSDWYRSQE
jgi:hypothetical protein